MTGTAIGRAGIAKKDNRKLNVNGASGRLKNLTYAFYDGSFSIFFSVCVSLSYDVFFFYHKAYAKNVFIFCFLNQLLVFQFLFSSPYLWTMALPFGTISPLHQFYQFVRSYRPEAGLPVN